MKIFGETFCKVHYYIFKVSVKLYIKQSELRELIQYLNNLMFSRLTAHIVNTWKTYSPLSPKNPQKNHLQHLAKVAALRLTHSSGCFIDSFIEHFITHHWHATGFLRGSRALWGSHQKDLGLLPSCSRAASPLYATTYVGISIGLKKHFPGEVITLCPERTKKC